MKKNELKLSTLLISTSLMAMSSNASAAALEEVVVTAQKVSQNLQSTPIAVTALTAAGIESRGLTDISELQSFAPTLVFDTTAAVSGASSAAAVTIRGVGQTDYSMTTEPGVGIYVDGVYVARSIGGVLDVVDLERIEVLRGPQGTLFGRNTIGGAVDLISKRPSDEFGGDVKVTVGNLNRINVQGNVDLPLSDNVRSRISISSINRDGFVKGLVDGREYGDENSDSIRGLFDIDLSDKLTARLALDYSRIREQNAASTLAGVTPGPGDLVGYGPQFIPEDVDTTFATGPNDGTSLDVEGAALTLNWALNDSLDLKSITSYRQTDGSFSADADNSPLVVTEMRTNPFEHEQFTQELQLSGTLLNDSLTLVAGLYYLDEEGQDILDVPIVPEILGSVVNHQVVESTSEAAYIQGTYSATDKLGVTLGVRYTEDEKSFDPINSSLTLPGGAGSVVFVPAGKVTETFTNTSPKFGLEYQVNDDLFTYLSYTEGFKSGGFNVRYLVPRDSVLEFEPEELSTTEIGFKWTGLDNRLRVNGAIFDTDYEDIQVVVFEAGGAPAVQNAGAAEIKGFELELNLAATENLDINAGLGYLDAEYTEINSPTTALVEESAVTLNDALPNAPEWSANLALEYRVNLKDSAELALRGDWSYSDDIANDAQNSPFLFQEAYDLLNLSATYTAGGGDWSITLFVENVTDERYIQAGNSNFGLGFHEANYSTPRLWGATYKMNF